jgi:hypothetical protein
MPTFEQLILSAPFGFANASLTLNKLVEGLEEEATIIDELVSESWNEAINRTDATTKEAIQLSLQYSNEKKVISFIIRSMRQANPAPSISNAANILAGNSFLTKETIEKILIKIKELSSKESTDIKQILKVSDNINVEIVFLFFNALVFL